VHGESRGFTGVSCEMQLSGAMSNTTCASRNTGDTGNVGAANFAVPELAGTHSYIGTGVTGRARGEAECRTADGATGTASLANMGRA